LKIGQFIRSAPDSNGEDVAGRKHDINKPWNPYQAEYVPRVETYRVPPESPHQRNCLDLCPSPHARTQFQFLGRAPGDARDERRAAGIQTHQG
jgi:hypothetical protein